MKIVFATQNQNKADEIASILPNHIQVLTLSDLNHNQELEESSDTLQGNAEQKAKFIFEKYGHPCFADDTGLLIKSLNNEPGVYSARYAGEEKNNEANMDLVLSKLESNVDRSAKFMTVIAFASENGLEIYEGEVKGQITLERRGKEGFGYDPIFLPEGSEKTFAEMSLEEKNEISHRARAFKNFIERF
ncbi:MAG: RdgB/HAM1 family non-canonical purine NTP pyrophosphatase [Crocinitomicaceae bacterium]|nr:RdgB/HAM1 family non-canonical purine NTP pyrophosphatase [Crocinitomicaceae bacterium]